MILTKVPQVTEKTFIIIKPDALERGLFGRIMSRLEDMGLHIEKIEKRIKNKVWCRFHYANVRAACDIGSLDASIYTRLVTFMVNASLIGVVLRGNNAIQRVRAVVGATDVMVAVPGTIRGDFGKYSGPYNLIHASDSEVAVHREIKLFFDKETDIGYR